MLVIVYPLLQLLEVLPLPDLNLLRHERLTTVDLLYDIVNHDACLVALKFSGLKILVCSLNGIDAIVFSWTVSAHHSCRQVGRVLWSQAHLEGPDGG